MRSLFIFIQRGRCFKGIATALCLTVLLCGLTGCGKKGPPVAPSQTQSEKSISSRVPQP